MIEDGHRQRIDRWLWYARVVRTRAAAAGLVAAGHVRLNGQRIIAPGKPVRAGDIITIRLDGGVRVLRIQRLADRRGSAADAASLFKPVDHDIKLPTE